MQSSSSTQWWYDHALAIRSRAKRARTPFKPFWFLAHDFCRARIRRNGSRRWVNVEVYGKTMLAPSEHDLAFILQDHPQYNRGLALAVTALRDTTTLAAQSITVVDVGANIGETVAVIEERNPGVCEYLCIEADKELAAACRANHSNSHCVEVIEAFIGEEEGMPVRLVDDGRANGTTTQAEDVNAPTLVKLDTALSPFAEKHGLSLLKVDTEGMDFAVLRSGQGILERFRPAIFFEWFTTKLREVGEDPFAGFKYLESIGYKHFVFFVAGGAYYVALSSPTHLILQSLAAVAEQNPAVLYFDVFAATSPLPCERLVDLATSARPLALAIEREDRICHKAPGIA